MNSSKLLKNIDFKIKLWSKNYKAKCLNNKKARVKLLKNCKKLKKLLPQCMVKITSYKNKSNYCKFLSKVR
jgi:hypothetical protein